MKTLLELNALIPTIIEMMNEEQPEIGDYEEGEYESNTLTYEEDGWTIEIVYKCTGYWNIEDETYSNPGCADLLKGWGEIENIYAFHLDEETAEETEFSSEDLTDLYNAVNKNLKQLA